MVKQKRDYSLFFKFLKDFTPTGFQGIHPDDSRLSELNQLMETNKQFIYVADIIEMKVLFTSKQSSELLGVDPENINPHYFMDATHPDDIQRLNLGRTKLIRMAQDLFIAKKGSAIISTNFRIKKITGKYSNFLVQCYLYYSNEPYNTVYFLKIHTNIDWCKKIKHGYHYYIGNDLSYFKYPNKALLNKGNVFTKREFDIIKLIAADLKTDQIAEKLFLSPYTINTHRGNILKKTKKENISELIYDLMERGLL